MATDISIRPTIIDRGEQIYAGMRRTITMSTFNEVADRIPELFTWLTGKHAVPAGPPFIKLNVIDMDDHLETEAGIPVAQDIFDEDPVFVGVLPSGRYVSYTHRGHPDDLVGVTAAVLDWAAGQGIVWDMRQDEDGEHWGARMMVLLTNPMTEPDPSNWETELLFRIADPT
jgi:effector-binding domain-containing protein